MAENALRQIEGVEGKLSPDVRRLLAIFKTLGTEAQRGRGPEFPKVIIKSMMQLFFAFKSLAGEGNALGTETLQLFKTASAVPPEVSDQWRKARTGGSFTSVHKRLWGIAKEMYQRISPKEKLLVDPLLVPFESLRSNRDPAPALKKLAHGTILVNLLFAAALPRTSSDFLGGEELTSKELKEVFDLYCGVCQEPHQVEAVKKLKARFLDNLFTRASKYKGANVREFRISQSASSGE